MAIREIRLFGDDVLRKKSRTVDEVDDKTRQILKDMVDTMYNTENGCGLAAPQIGILKRLVVIDMGTGIIQLVNPQIIKEEGIQMVTEGCLSNPNVWGKLKRPYKVTVSALNEAGEEIVISGEGDMAKCLCHEIDHLEGKLFTDLVEMYL